MKVTGGTAAGIVLATPRNMKVRPTGVRAKQALFNSLQSSDLIRGAVVVDLFAGTGGLGLEAASRGASEAYLVEKSNLHCRMAEENAGKLRRSGVLADISIIRADVCFVPTRLASIAGKIDLIFADPPYAESELYFHTLLSDKDFTEWADNALIIWEQPPDINLISDMSGLFCDVDSIRSFGGTRFIFMRSGIHQNEHR